MRKISVIVIFIALAHVANAQILNTNIGFESGSFTPQWRNNTYDHPTSVTEVVSAPHPVRDGNYSLHIETQYDYRNEMIPSETTNPQPGIFYYGDEYWYSTSIYLVDYSVNYPTWSTIVQLHSVPGNNNWNCCAGDNGWTLGTSNQYLQIHSNVLDNPYEIPTCAARNGHAWQEPVSDYENRWVDIVVNFKLSVNNDGFIRWWIDGKLILELTGPNVHYYDVCGVPRIQYAVLQTGIYKQRERTDIKRELYFDEIRIAGANSNYADVAPRGGAIVNSPPVLSSIGNKSINEGELLNISISSSDAEGDSRNFSISPSLGFVTLTDNQNGTGSIRIEPNSGDAGTYNITVTVTDSNNGSDFETFTIVVNSGGQGNSAPVLSPIGTISVSEGNVFSLQLSSSDPDEDERSFKIEPALGFVTLTNTFDGTATLNIAPVIGDANTYTQTVTVTDVNLANDSETFSLIINPGNQSNSSPVLSPIGVLSVTEGNVINVQLSSSDAEGDARNFSLSPDLDFVTLTDNQNGTGNLRIAPLLGDANTYYRTITVTDANNGSDSETIEIRVFPVEPVNAAPVLSPIGTLTVAEGNVLSLQLSSIDPDGDERSFIIEPALGFVTLTNAYDGTASLIIAPDFGDANTYTQTVRVTDVNLASDYEIFTLIVSPGNQSNSSPVLSPIAIQSVTEGNVINVPLSSSDAEGDARSFSLSPNLGFVTLTDNQNGTGNLRIAPVLGDANTYYQTVTVTDSNNGSHSRTMEIRVYSGGQVNVAPVLSTIGGKSVYEGSVLNVQLASSDANGDAISFSLSPDLGFVTLTDNQNGTATLRIAPLLGDANTYYQTVTVSDDNNGSDSETIEIRVYKGGQVNVAPVLSPIGGKSVYEGYVSNVQLFSSDADGDERSFSLSPDLGFVTLTDNGNGTATLRIAPLIGDANTYNQTVTVTDSNNGSVSETIEIRVYKVTFFNTPPSISSIEDKIVNLGNVLNVPLKASDPDGNTMSFSIKPDFGFVSLSDNFDGNGMLTISPIDVKPGIYTISVTVTDANGDSDSEDFSITINEGVISSYALRINSGGPTVIFGNTDLQEDQFFQGGEVNINSEPIDYTQNDELYQSERSGSIMYDIPLPANGKYGVRLHFAEIIFTDGETGSRIFDVEVENGQALLENYDINAEVGPLAASVKTFTGIEVMDGKLTINLHAVIGEPKISGIEVFSELQLTTDLEEEDIHEDFSIYPNPSNGKFTINFSEFDHLIYDIPLVIYDMTGRIVQQSSIQDSETHIDISGKNEGVYILRIGNYKTEKILLY